MHKAKACVISCIDFRFQETLEKFIQRENLGGEFDLISVAGSARDLVKPIEMMHQENLFRQVDISMRLHQPEKIIVIDHQDCGGWAQDGTIPGGLTMDKDRDNHKKFSEELKNLLMAKYPDKEIKNYYFTLDGQILELNG